LSSSASLQVTFYTFLEQIALLSEKISPKEKAEICQKAEQKFAGMPCGIMDQMIITCGKSDHAMLLDCRTLNFEFLPFNDPQVVVLVTNTNVKHELTGSEYSERREICHEAAAKFGKRSLRDVSFQEFQVNEPKISSVMHRRVKHVIAEIQRTKEAADALAAKNYEKFGQLMKQSHASLRDDFEVSCPELDQCADIANAQSGVYGSRMTGGGFGGCTVTLVKKEAVQQLMEAIRANYDGKPTFIVCTAVNGAKPVSI